MRIKPAIFLGHKQLFHQLEQDLFQPWRLSDNLFPEHVLLTPSQLQNAKNPILFYDFLRQNFCHLPYLSKPVLKKFQKQNPPPTPSQPNIFLPLFNLFVKQPLNFSEILASALRLSNLISISSDGLPPFAKQEFNQWQQQWLAYLTKNLKKSLSQKNDFFYLAQLLRLWSLDLYQTWQELQSPKKSELKLFLNKIQKFWCRKKLQLYTELLLEQPNSQYIFWSDFLKLLTVAILMQWLRHQLNWQQPESTQQRLALLFINQLTNSLLVPTNSELQKILEQQFCQDHYPIDAWAIHWLKQQYRLLPQNKNSISTTIAEKFYRHQQANPYQVILSAPQKNLTTKDFNPLTCYIHALPQTKNIAYHNCNFVKPLKQGCFQIYWQGELLMDNGGWLKIPKIELANYAKQLLKQQHYLTPQKLLRDWHDNLYQQDQRQDLEFYDNSLILLTPENNGKKSSPHLAKITLEKKSNNQHQPLEKYLSQKKIILPAITEKTNALMPHRIFHGGEQFFLEQEINPKAFSRKFQTSQKKLPYLQNWQEKKEIFFPYHCNPTSPILLQVNEKIISPGGINFLWLLPLSQRIIAQPLDLPTPRLEKLWHKPLTATKPAPLLGILEQVNLLAERSPMQMPNFLPKPSNKVILTLRPKHAVDNTIQKLLFCCEGADVFLAHIWQDATCYNSPLDSNSQIEYHQRRLVAAPLLVLYGHTDAGITHITWKLELGN